MSDFERALLFYRLLMRTLDLAQRWLDPDRRWAGWHRAGGSRLFFAMCKPFDGQPDDPGNGQMVTFMAKDGAMVRKAQAVALANGATDTGAPGLRPHDYPNDFGVDFRDLDSNKLCLACHDAEPAR